MKLEIYRSDKGSRTWLEASGRALEVAGPDADATSAAHDGVDVILKKQADIFSDLYRLFARLRVAVDLEQHSGEADAAGRHILITLATGDLIENYSRQPLFLLALCLIDARAD